MNEPLPPVRWPALMCVPVALATLWPLAVDMLGRATDSHHPIRLWGLALGMLGGGVCVSILVAQHLMNRSRALHREYAERIALLENPHLQPKAMPILYRPHGAQRDEQAANEEYHRTQQARRQARGK